MALTATWTGKEFHENDTYKVSLSATLTNEEADRFYELWIASFLSGTLGAVAGNAGPTVTTGGNLTKTRDVDNINTKVLCTGYGYDPEDTGEHLIKNIKAILLALTANDTQVTEANVVTTGELAVYAAAQSLTLTIGTP